MTEVPPIPLAIRTRLAHATLQSVADQCGADIFHVKGAALDAVPPSERAPSRSTQLRMSQDADVLVRPRDLRKYARAMRQNGWTQYTRLYSGGVVEHSTDWHHEELGQADIHCRFPGLHVPAEHAFERLWGEREIHSIANRPCPVPSRAAQRLVLLLHAARNTGAREGDVQLAWVELDAEERSEILSLAADLHAEVALSVVTGHLDDHRHEPEYELWRILAAGDVGLPRIVAILRAAPNKAERIKNAFRLVRWMLYLIHSKRTRLSAHLGRRPTNAEVLQAHYGTVRTICHDLSEMITKELGNGKLTF